MMLLNHDDTKTLYAGPDELPDYPIAMGVIRSCESHVYMKICFMTR